MNSAINILLHLHRVWPEGDPFITLGGIQGEKGSESTLRFHVWVSRVELTSVTLSHLERLQVPEAEWPEFLANKVRKG